MATLSELEFALKDLHESLYQLRSVSTELRDAMDKEANDDTLRYLISKVNGWCAVVKTDRLAVQEAMKTLQSGLIQEDV